MRNDGRKRTGKFAITGGIGSGKSAFCDCLKKLGYPVFSCDEISRGLWKDRAYREGLVQRFPQYAEGGEIQKKRFAAAVFQDKRLLSELNEYAHPLIMERLSREMETVPVGFAEVPLLFEGGFEGLFDGVIVVMRNRAARVESVYKRDGCNSDVLTRMARQVDYDSLDCSDYIVVRNDGAYGELYTQAKAVLIKLGLE